LKKLDTSLYFITDSTGLEENVFLYQVEQALSGGVTIMQIREKDKSTREYMHLAEKVHEIAVKYNVPLIIDDRLDVALAVGAEGVHLGQSDMPVNTARKIVGDNMIIGATTKTVEQALEAVKNGADYLGVGAIYPTTTKVKTVLTSVDTLKEICKAVSVPVNAIGGLNKDNCHVLANTGISGICVVSAIMKSPEPRKAAEELRQISEKLKLSV